MLKNKAAARDVLRENIDILISNAAAKEQTIQDMTEHGVLSGYVLSYVADPSRIETADIRFVGSMLSSLYNSTLIDELNPKHYFTENEMIDVRQYHESINDDGIDFPLVFNNVMDAGNGEYFTLIGSDLIARLNKHKKLYYNYDIQREARKIVRDNNVIIRPTIIRKNVDEIRELILQKGLFSTNIAFNIPFNSLKSDDDIIYDSKNKTLTLSENVRLDMLDGAHRCLACLEAYQENREVVKHFLLRITNHTTEEARQYQAQIAKHTPMSQSRIQELESEEHSDLVVQILNSDSELKGKISSLDRPRRGVGELVTFHMLSEYIDNEYEIKSRIEARRLAQDLAEFFEVLMDYFVNHEQEEDSLLKDSRMFSGYIILSKRMKDEGVPYLNLDRILDKVDFSKDNPEWKKGKIIKSNFINQKSIDSFFKKMKL